VIGYDRGYPGGIGGLLVNELGEEVMNMDVLYEGVLLLLFIATGLFLIVVMMLL